ncbi:hypothetical protein QJQ45_025679 [Haematococcus lacustris]|nr:hypothetical protein QJQ45_025679 [Haematococcus lacustris]
MFSRIVLHTKCVVGDALWRVQSIRSLMQALHLGHAPTLNHRSPISPTSLSVGCSLHTIPQAAPRQRHTRRALLAQLGVFSTAVNPAHASAACVEEITQPQSAVQSEVVAGPSTSGSSAPNPPTFVTATGRIVAIGDLHGDWNKAIESFRVAGVIKILDNDEVVWRGGDTVVVQLGDVLDRGDNEIAIVKLLRGLDQQAREHGGAVYMLNGNHESLNICGDFRYVTPGAFVESALFAGLTEHDLRDWELLARVRFAVYKPGGPMAMELSKNPTVLVVNDTVFAHGGLLPSHVKYGLENLNNQVAAWMRADKTSETGKAAPPFIAMGDASSVMWNRSLSKERFPTPYERFHACSSLKQALQRLGASRLVVGHTPQLSGANCECEGAVWRIDVGMSYGVLNRPVQVLEITQQPDGQQQVRVLGPHQSSSASSYDDEETGSVDF